MLDSNIFEFKNYLRCIFGSYKNSGEGGIGGCAIAARSHFVCPISGRSRSLRQTRPADWLSSLTRSAYRLFDCVAIIAYIFPDLLKRLRLSRSPRMSAIFLACDHFLSCRSRLMAEFGSIGPSVNSNENSFSCFVCRAPVPLKRKWTSIF